jgi:nitric oxide dioxygenase
MAIPETNGAPATIAAPITPEQIAIVKSTAPAFQEHGETITTLFYGNMLKANPELHNIFNRTSQVTGAQPRALAASVLGYATYVDDLGKLQAVVERIAHKHVSLTIQPEQYAVVGKHLIEAVATVLGDAVTQEVANAWIAAYGALADIFINREKQLYTAQDGWTGYRRFKIQKKVAESADVTSFYLAPEDGKSLPPFHPGQYISLQLFIPELNCLQPRQYSLSDAHRSDYYRISVRKDAGKTPGMPGLISNLLHDKYNEADVVEITHPTGDFFVDCSAVKATPLILISAGVGITPMLSILNSTVTAGSKQAVSWIHGTHSTELQAFGKHMQTVRSANPNVQTTVFKSKVTDADAEGVDYTFAGRVDLAKLQPSTLFLEDTTAQYYVCGPTFFMTDMHKALLGRGVDGERVHMEIFGTGNGE